MKRRNFLRTEETKRFETNQYKNPVKRRKFRIPRKFIRAAIFIFTACIIIAIPITLTIKLPSFYIETIEISGTEAIKEHEIWDVVHAYHQKQSLWYSNRHIWFHNSDDLSELLMSSFPIRQLDISRNKRHLQINVQENTQFIIIHNADEWTKFYRNGESHVLTDLELDSVSSIINRGEGTDNAHIPVDVPIIEFIRNLNQNGVGEDIFSSIDSVNLKLIEQGIQPIVYIFESQDDTWVRVRTELGFDILIELIADTDKQISVLNQILEERSSDIQGIEYIDIRFSDRVYIK